MSSLQPEPESSAIAAEAAEPYGHLRREEAEAPAGSVLSTSRGLAPRLKVLANPRGMLLNVGPLLLERHADHLCSYLVACLAHELNCVEIFILHTVGPPVGF